MQFDKFDSECKEHLLVRAKLTFPHTPLTSHLHSTQQLRFVNMLDLKGTIAVYMPYAHACIAFV